MDSRSIKSATSGSLDRLVKAKVGQQVIVFNQVSDNWLGEIVALNKNTARVRVGGTLDVFTNHAYARGWLDSEHEEYLVPYSDLRSLGPNDGGERRDD